ncbi:hypothetical protein [Sphingomonas sanguinis]|uniref:Uncharacterized protein n=1 Tax=Sphingomonas sanguinis TaxID=33051 RepID=A0A147J410_9SPHN|nr:hypothetical protein [Sphingomonas sanguinis]KTW04819.1 hypothetical protein NS258_17715 [Sphingomonas sanguinis]
MTDPFDRDLARLARSAPPAALDDLEQRIAAAIGAAPSAEPGFAWGMALAGAAALMLGVAGGGIMAGRSEARDRPPVVVAALDTGLAPPTLLLGR